VTEVVCEATRCCDVKAQLWTRLDLFQQTDQQSIVSLGIDLSHAAFALASRMETTFHLRPGGVVVVTSQMTKISAESAAQIDMRTWRPSEVGEPCCTAP
jgi:hypothetical protein